MSTDTRFNNGILYSRAIWRKLNNNNQQCSITAAQDYIVRMNMQNEFKFKAQVSGDIIVHPKASWTSLI